MSAPASPSPAPDIPPHTRAAQANATDPLASAWVSANAGSGKTYVLVGRVVRLLLAGTDPGRILCLTYTTAAAANMAQRVFDQLAKFAVLGDADLALALEKIEGRVPDANGLASARRLFARALETPGGLKIQTIHAFCASLLAQFPLEANVAGRFTVIDDQMAAELVEAGLAVVLRRVAAEPEGDLGRMLNLLVGRLTDGSLREMVGELVARREILRAWLRESGGVEGAVGALAPALGLRPGDSLDSLVRAFCDGCAIPFEALTRLGEALASGGKRAGDRLADLTLYRDPAVEAGARQTAWMRMLFDSKGLPRGFEAALTKPVAAKVADLAPAFEAEQARVTDLLDRLTAARAMESTRALVTLADAVLDHVEGEKRRRGLIDYSDQVARAADLLTRTDAAAWVRYKLDRGVEHILVDEAQDTSPLQWRVVRSLAEEFFAGESAFGGRRTMFAVGDEKQSIYGFQGAAPEEFARMRRDFRARSEGAALPFHNVELHLSFRSTPDVLAAVDAVFADPAAHAGLTSPSLPPVHEAIRRAEPGLVEIWPPVAPAEREADDDWLAALDRLSPASPQAIVAERIADTIARWMERGERLSNGRRIAPGDILVLVRKRGPFVEAVSRALKRRGVPVAGADQIVLSDHIAVMDLVALGRVLLLPADDLNLAAVLKGPLFGVDETTLFELAHGRTGTLWAALAARAANDAAAAAILERLEGWRARLDRIRPFELYAGVLGRDGGRAAFLARLGPEADDVLDAFLSAALSHESTEPPTLEGFLAWFTARPFRVRRETETNPREVRVMTVHGSKGLEAPVVFLVDGGGPPVHAQHDPKIVAVPLAPPEAEAAPGLVWAPSKALRPAAVERRIVEERERAAAEYRRLLYVAMTRAADRLYVCGWSPKNGPAEQSWTAMVARGLAPAAVAATDHAGRQVLRWRKPDGADEDGWMRGEGNAGPGQAGPEPITGRREHGPVDAIPPAEDVAADGATPAPAALPPWLLAAPPPVPPAPRAVTPSSALSLADAEDGEDTPFPTVAVPGAGETAALARGRLIHRAMELIAAGGISGGDAMRAAIDRLAEADPALAGDAPEAVEHRRRIADEILAVTADPAFAPLFSAAGRSEVTLAGRLTARSGEPIEVSARIDRLVVEDGRVVVVDFKTDRRVPDGASDVPETHLAQVALYRALVRRLFPGRAVEAALLYTAGPRLIVLPPGAIDAAAARLIRD
ncbi:DNA helicase/exodeoxyribonuclease V, subunit A [Pseudoxanthobacter soli DSM 19599]|uniref:DNA 3'-5' helicase n=1 Tax=Pseudoxanthobacter soli DSM 19599 TaxID=1123029 RepID=A0A1M7ZJ27_9HYPH|nr:double-strand break repair helicase AddA [Pseudoxanthobacter soli]SHO64901.1 DNA helicase/exodeoxyribonuclease V, subunit A [Pseudoxanthobacter soli DSM 19599]